MHPENDREDGAAALAGTTSDPGATRRREIAAAPASKTAPCSGIAQST